MFNSIENKLWSPFKQVWNFVFWPQKLLNFYTERSKLRSPSEARRSKAKRGIKFKSEWGQKTKFTRVEWLSQWVFNAVKHVALFHSNHIVKLRMWRGTMGWKCLTCSEIISRFWYILMHSKSPKKECFHWKKDYLNFAEIF